MGYNSVAGLGGNSVVNVGVGGQSYSTSAFGELRTSSPLTLVDAVMRYAIPPELYGSSTVGGGLVAYVGTEQAARLSVTNANADSAVLQTHEHYRYQAGRGWRGILTTICGDAGKANNRRRWGWFTDGVVDPGDGWFFELNGTALSIVRRSSVTGAPVDTPYAQAAWNVDPMDGTGPSGVTLDVTRGNIYEISFQWLGVGTVRLFINGWLVHEVDHANTLTVPYMRTGQLPVRWENVNTAGTSGASTLTAICASVFAESGNEPPHLQYGYGTGVINLTTARVALLSMRPASLYLTIPNRNLVLPEVALGSMTNRTGNGFAVFEIVLNPTSITGATFAVVPDATSCVQIDIAGSTVTGGTSVLSVALGPDSAYDLLSGGHDSGFFGRLGRKLMRRFAGTLDVLSLVAAMSAGTGDVVGSLSWSEIR